jgi:hypothetical protein
VGCEQCQGSGYIGRLGLYEFIELDAGLIGLLYDGAVSWPCRITWLIGAKPGGDGQRLPGPRRDQPG